VIWRLLFSEGSAICEAGYYARQQPEVEDLEDPKATTISVLQSIHRLAVHQGEGKK